jgi:dolichol-phosphate mannosyltransferase
MSPLPNAMEHPEAPQVSIVLATLNERTSIEPLLTTLFDLDLPPLEVVVVDDGSVDGTRDYVRAAALTDPRIRLLCHDGCQTLTTAQLQGIRAARGKYVIIMDADLQHPPSVVPKIVRALQGGKCLVVASRYAPTGEVGERTRYRALLSKGAESMARFTLTAARDITDPISGFFGCERELALPMNPSTRGYKLLLFLLVLSEGKGVGEIGYQFGPRSGGSTKIAHGTAFLRMFTAELMAAKQLELWKRSPRSRATRVRPRSLDSPSVTGSSSSGDPYRAWGH